MKLMHKSVAFVYINNELSEKLRKQSQRNIKPCCDAGEKKERKQPHLQPYKKE